MSPLVHARPKLREGGRIRLGVKKTKSDGTEYPSAITKFRITSSNREVLEVLAGLYGGKVTTWARSPTEGQFELLTESSSMDVVLPPTEFGFSQNMELWKGGTCERRCDQQWEKLSDGPCLCDSDEPQCKPRTRLSVVFPQLDSWTLFRVETGSWNAANEMGATIELINTAKAASKMLPARLLLEQRQKKVRNKEDKVETLKFVVLGLEIALSKLTLEGGEAPRILVDSSSGEILEAEPKAIDAPRPRVEERQPAPTEAPEPKAPEELVTDAQIRKIAVGFGKLGVSESQDRREWIEGIVHRTLSSTRELTKREAMAVIDRQTYALSQWDDDGNPVQEEF